MCQNNQTATNKILQIFKTNSYMDYICLQYISTGMLKKIINRKNKFFFFILLNMFICKFILMQSGKSLININ